jgi:hypothetical protein
MLESQGMKLPQLGLWAIGAAMCATSLGFLVGDFDRDEEPSRFAEAVSSSAPAQALAASVTAEAPQVDSELDAVDPAAQGSTHAIVPDTQATVPKVEAPSPQPAGPIESTPTPQATAPGTAPPVKEISPPITNQSSASAEPSENPSATPKDELVTITSAAVIRNGPSSSANVIGRAHSGAQARVAATESGWAQIVDPASGNKGWVESGVLAPAPNTETAATDEPPDAVAPDSWSEDQRAAMSEDRPSVTKSKRSAKGKRHAKHHHGHRRFAFRFVIRGF